mgnify:CR=1 FL=1
MLSTNLVQCRAVCALGLERFRPRRRRMLVGWRGKLACLAGDGWMLIMERSPGIPPVSPVDLRRDCCARRDEQVLDGVDDLDKLPVRDSV